MGLTIIRNNCPCCDSQSISKVLQCKDHTVSKETFDVWECAACKIRFTQNVPESDFIGTYYQSDAYISHTDTEKGLVNKIYKIARNYTLKWKMKLVHRYTGKHVKNGFLLDIGAGTGAFLNTMVAANWSVFGLEPDEGARKICNDKYHLQLHPPAELFQLPTEKFDVVTLWHVLEHVHQLHEYIEQIKRVLKKDGVAFIALPNYLSKDAQQYGAYWAAYDVPRHLYHFSPFAMQKLMEQHNMIVEATQPMWLDAYYIAMLSEQYKRGKSNLLAAVLNGLNSNRYARRNKETCSSLVYIIKKTN